MLAEISVGLGSLKAATDILKGLNAANTQAAINEAKISLQEKIFDAREALSAAQDSQAACLKKVRELEDQIVQLKDWERDKQRYQLQTIDSGSFAYMPKPGMENGEPPHWLCTNCFSRGQKSYLQFKGQERTPSGLRGDHSTYGCDSCKATVKVFYTTKPEAPSTS